MLNKGAMNLSRHANILSFQLSLSLSLSLVILFFFLFSMQYNSGRELRDLILNRDGGFIFLNMVMWRDEF